MGYVVCVNSDILCNFIGGKMNIHNARIIMEKYLTTYFGSEVDVIICSDSDLIAVRKTIFLNSKEYSVSQDALMAKLAQELDKTLYVKKLNSIIEDLKSKLAEYRHEEISKETLSEL